MKLLLGLFLLLVLNQAAAQFQVIENFPKYELPVVAARPIGPTIFGWRPDKEQVYGYQSPSLTSLPASNTFNASSSFWINKVSSQSYNNGRFGTYYYWDVQGNLRDTRGFIDLSRKNKLHFKLLFPWH